MLLLTDLEVHVRFVMDLQVSLPAGSIDVFGVVRYVGPTKFGRGVGVSLMALSDTERQSWKTFYNAALSASRETVRLQTGRG